MVTSTSQSVYAKRSRSGVLILVFLMTAWLPFPLFGATDPADPQNAESDIHLSETQGHDTADLHHELPEGYELPKWWAVIPFVCLLLSIAILPLFRTTEHWWEDNRNRLLLSLSLSVCVLVYYWLVHPGVIDHDSGKLISGFEAVHKVLNHALLQEYIPFIVLLFSLYTISGGIQLKGDLPAHPLTNTIFLAVGTLIASFVGTTGAAMLLIRPLIQTNSERKHVKHTIIFFIFLVCNVGGCLLPVGDPPLFLGYLMGVPFLWTMGLWTQWLGVSIMLLIIYYIWDSIAYRKETKRAIARDEREVQKLRMSGSINLLFLLGVILSVAFLIPGKPLFGMEDIIVPHFFREFVQGIFIVLSLKFTPIRIREANRFNYMAIGEVAALFIGIFITMQIPVEILNIKGGQLGMTEPWQFFWATGLLSSVLDNAPTYVVFFETAKSVDVGAVTRVAGIPQELLVAISLGAVFMGANTYIGNGPNFMVKSIAEQHGIKMPSFFGYMLYSLVVLLPVFLVFTLVMHFLGRWVI